MLWWGELGFGGRMSGAAGPIAYLTGQYPAPSHTFIQREIAGLRRAGFVVLPCSVRRTAPALLTGPEERAAAAETFAILDAARNPLRLAAAHLACFAAAPRRYLRALRLAAATPAPGLGATLWQVFYFAEAGVLARHLRRTGARHLHNHFTDSSCTVAMLASALSGIPFSFTMHGPADFFAPAAWRLSDKIAAARFVACISWFCRAQGMLFSAPEHWGKLHVIHCAVEPERYGAPVAEAGRAAEAGQGPARLLYVGRLAAVKGLRVLFEALAAFGQEGPRLVLVGDGPDRAALEREAAARGLGDRIRFDGYRSQGEVAAALAEADLFVLPSFAEGVPVVLMEAMASRKPVVATRVGGVSELVEDGVSGLLVPPSDAAALGAAIGRLAAEPALRARMGAAGRAKVEAEFALAGEAERLAGLFAAYAGPAAPGGGSGGGSGPVPAPRPAAFRGGADGGGETR